MRRALQCIEPVPPDWAGVVTIGKHRAVSTQSSRTHPDSMDNNQFTIETAQEFHRRMAAIIDTVQAGIWQEEVHSLLGYATDYAFGQERGLQTLVLKTRNRSTYVRLRWDTILGDTHADRESVDDVVRSAIRELS